MVLEIALAYMLNTYPALKTTEKYRHTQLQPPAIVETYRPSNMLETLVKQNQDGVATLDKSSYPKIIEELKMRSGQSEKAFVRFDDSLVELWTKDGKVIAGLFYSLDSHNEQSSLDQLVDPVGRLVIFYKSLPINTSNYWQDINRIESVAPLNSDIQQRLDESYNSYKNSQRIIEEIEKLQEQRIRDEGKIMLAQTLR